MKRYPTPDMDEYAGVLDRRAEALFLDVIAVFAVLGVGGFVLGDLFVGGAVGAFGTAWFAVVFVTPVALFAYQIVFEGYYGRTLGKYARGIVVAQSDGSPVTWGGAVIRNLLRIVDALPVAYLLGIVVSFTREDNGRLGDVVADTVVVRTTT